MSSLVQAPRPPFVRVTGTPGSVNVPVQIVGVTSQGHTVPSQQSYAPVPSPTSSTNYATYTWDEVDGVDLGYYVLKSGLLISALLPPGQLTFVDNAGAAGGSYTPASTSPLKIAQVNANFGALKANTPSVSGDVVSIAPNNKILCGNNGRVPIISTANSGAANSFGTSDIDVSDVTTMSVTINLSTPNAGNLRVMLYGRSADGTLGYLIADSGALTVAGKYRLCAGRGLPQGTFNSGLIISSGIPLDEGAVQLYYTWSAAGMAFTISAKGS